MEPHLWARLHPSAKDADNLFEPAGIARTLKALAGNGACKPVSALCFEAQLLRAGVYRRGSDEIDGQVPAGIFERAGSYQRLQAHPLSVLPLAVTLPLIPVIQPLKIVAWH